MSEDDVIALAKKCDPSFLNNEVPEFHFNKHKLIIFVNELAKRIQKENDSTA